MKILVDENIPMMTVRALLDLGHEVLDLRGTPDQGVTDEILWAMAQREQRTLITTDKGFARYRNAPHQGILIIRLRQPNRRRIHERVLRAFARFGPEEWQGMLVVMRDSVQSISRKAESEPAG
jgi:predicted nuclease of predicted toxin-antitoxin system